MKNKLNLYNHIELTFYVEKKNSFFLQKVEDY